jgi:hypothetical protein
MAYDRTVGEEEARRFKLFIDVFSELKEQLGDRAVRTPTFRAPSNLLRFAEIQLLSPTPLRSRASAEFLLGEIDQLLLSDPVLASSTEVRVPFVGLRAAAATVVAAPSRDRPGLAAQCLPPTLEPANAVIDTGRYFDAALDLLLWQICDARPLSVAAMDIEQTTRCIVFALLAAGFSVEMIGTFKMWLTSYPFEGDRYVVHTLPSEINRRQYFSGMSFDLDTYNCDLLLEQRSLTIRDRLRALKKWYSEVPEPCTVIFRVVGAIGNREFDVDDVTFYPALIGHPKYITCSFGEALRDEEVFDQPGRMNAAVTVSARDASSARSMAMQRVNKALDTLRYTFEGKFPIGIDGTRSSMADKYGHYFGGKYSVDVSANPLLWFNFDLMNQGAITTLVGNEAAIQALAADGERGQMRTALHALRRAAEAVAFEDRLLESWVVIESLLGAGSAITIAAANLEERVGDVISALVVDDYREARALDTFLMVKGALANQALNGHENDVSAPVSELAETLFVEQPEFVPMTAFLDDLRWVQAFVINPWLREKVDRTLRYYDDSSFAHAELEALRQETRGELVVIYQLRNQFVHQGRRDDQLMSYYARRAVFYARQLVWHLLQVTRKDDFKSTLQAIVDDLNVLMADLKLGITSGLMR